MFRRLQTYRVTELRQVTRPCSAMFYTPCYNAGGTLKGLIWLSKLYAERGISKNLSQFLVPLADNEWLYVFGFATHIPSFKAIQPIGKTDIYNVLATGRD